MTDKKEVEPVAPTPPPAPPVKPAKTPGALVVAPGKSLCCGGTIGILGPGKEVTEANLSGTPEQVKAVMKSLVSRGILVVQ